MTKADRIRQLARHGVFTDGEMLAIVQKEFGYCHPSYIRTCARQRTKGQSEADIAWYARNRTSKIAYNIARNARKRREDAHG